MIEEIRVKPRMHVFVCTNDRSGIPNNETPSCGPRITDQDVKDIKFWLRTQGYGDIFCTKTKCLGFCNEESSVICIYPQGKYIKGIQNKEDIKEIIRKEREKEI